MRRRLEVKHTIDEEVFKILSLQSDSISTFLEQKTEDLQERLLACRHCFREMSWKQLDDGLCPHCLERRKLHRRIFARLAPQVRTVGGIAEIGEQYVAVEGEGHWEISGTKEAEYVAEDQAKRFAESIY